MFSVAVAVAVAAVVAVADVCDPGSLWKCSASARRCRLPLPSVANAEKSRAWQIRFLWRALAIEMQLRRQQPTDKFKSPEKVFVELAGVVCNLVLCAFGPFQFQWLAGPNLSASTKVTSQTSFESVQKRVFYAFANFAIQTASS